ncbi:MAG: efflux RND transporter periplasmic adaptor subunit, partial [Burkholderiaceae bacterium]|nr:efflux RND transporter periplasmic adaptor subunit [Burkholderiaceae bacterium]
VQPGNAPAPYAVADLSTKWLIANVGETDSPLFHEGQEVHVKVMAFPGREFSAKVAVIGASVDPTTHTVIVRSEVKDPKHELRSGMFATYDIRTADKVHGLAIPADSAVREGDGSMTVWVTKDHRHFERHTVHLGLREEGYVQVTDGLQAGEQIAAKGAVFLSNMQNGTPD